MAIELYRDEQHICLAFENLVKGSGIQANQFLIMHGPHAALIDPGGNLTYTPLYMEIAKRISIKNLDYVIASHQDPDIVASLDKWLLYTECKIAISRLWERFLPHLVPGHMEAKGTDRIIGIPDRGTDIPLGDSFIRAVPAHFLHSVGSFSFYDPVSKILFSGDIGASIVPGGCREPVSDFDDHAHGMLAFHQRYMTSNKACRLWTNMVREMDVEMLVPQHGCPFKGKESIEQFLKWFERLECGSDLLTQSDYSATPPVS